MFPFARVNPNVKCPPETGPLRNHPRIPPECMLTLLSLLPPSLAIMNFVGVRGGSGGNASPVPGLYSCITPGAALCNLITAIRGSKLTYVAGTAGTHGCHESLYRVLRSTFLGARTAPSTMRYSLISWESTCTERIDAHESGQLTYAKRGLGVHGAEATGNEAVVILDL